MSDIAPPEVSVYPDMLVRGFNKQGTFVCKGFGIPRPNLTWNTEGLSSVRFSIAEGIELNDMGYEVTVLNLTLLDTSEDLEGSYICNGMNRVDNLIGTDEMSEGTFHIECMCTLLV